MKTCRECWYFDHRNDNHCQPCNFEKKEWEPDNRFYRFFFLLAKKLESWTKRVKGGMVSQNPLNGIYERSLKQYKKDHTVIPMSYFTEVCEKNNCSRRLDFPINVCFYYNPGTKCRKEMWLKSKKKKGRKKTRQK